MLFAARLVFFCTVVVLAACGRGSSLTPTESAKNFVGEKRNVAQALEDYEAAVNTDDVNGQCDAAAWDSERQKQHECLQPLEKKAMSDAHHPSRAKKPMYELTVKQVELQLGPVSKEDSDAGVDAGATVDLTESHGRKSHEQRAQLIRLHGKWVIAYFGRD